MSAIDKFLKDLTSGEEARAETAALELNRLGDLALPGLRNLLDSADADHRWWAVRTLAPMSGVDVNWFIKAMSDVSPEVRQAAALALAVHPAEEAAQILVRALSDNDGMVAVLSANALSAMGKPVVPILLEAYQQAPLPARIHIMRVLAEMHDSRAIPAMMKAMNEDSAILNHWAETGLQQLGLDMVYIKLS